MLTKNRLHLVLALALALTLAFPALNMAQAAGEKVLTWRANASGDMPTLDPALTQDTSSAQIIGETHYALVRDMEDKPGNIQAGVAEKWDVSADGKTYTFHLRKDVPWV